MFKKILALLLCASATIALTSCSTTQTNAPAGSDTSAESRIKVSVTFNAMKEFVEAVGGDKVEITTIIPDGTEPHDFEPKAADLVGLSTAQVFVYSGFGMESWVDEAIQSADNGSLISVEATSGITPIENTDENEIEEHGQYDPHAWLSLKCAETEIQNIEKALAKADPSNQNYYQTNSDAYVSQLESLYNEYYEKFQAVSKKSFVTGHAAFAYLCRDFGMSQNSVEDVFAEGEPTAQQLAELVEYCKSNNVKIIFAEELASPDVSQTLANQVGASVETIYTIESSEDDKSYLERMEENLAKIYNSLTA